MSFLWNGLAVGRSGLVALGVGLAWLASPAPGAATCIGDCNVDGEVTVDEIITGVNIALGTASIASCLAFDSNADGQVTVDEIVNGVTNALTGCPERVCGDGEVDFDLGETCDDGNTEDGDDCPANCRIEPCTPTGDTGIADIVLSVPGGASVAAVTVFLRYPDGVVRIPGRANDDQVQSRIGGLPEGLSTTPNDLDYALRLVAFSPDISPIPPGRFFTVEFDGCEEGGRLPTFVDFDCIVEDAADTSFNPVAGVTCAVTDFASTMPRCGDGVVDFELGETCDDGNTDDGDACPSTCRIEPCDPSGESVTFNVDFEVPEGVSLAALTTFLRYPDGVVRIPGFGNDGNVQSRLTAVPNNISATPNDLDYALRYVAFTPDLSPITEGGLYSVVFDRCEDAPAPSIGDFTCIVEDAADTEFNSVDGVSCSVRP